MYFGLFQYRVVRGFVGLEAIDARMTQTIENATNVI